MSIEQSLERIATALEKIAGKVIDEVDKSNDEKADIKSRSANEDAIPGAEDVTVNTLGPSLVKTPAELREFAQKYLEKAGDKATDFVKYIRESICAKFSPKEPKLIKIPEKNIPQAAQMIYDYAFKNSIFVS